MTDDAASPRRRALDRARAPRRRARSRSLEVGVFTTRLPAGLRPPHGRSPASSPSGRVRPALLAALRARRRCCRRRRRLAGLRHGGDRRVRRRLQLRVRQPDALGVDLRRRRGRTALGARSAASCCRSLLVPCYSRSTSGGVRTLRPAGLHARPRHVPVRRPAADRADRRLARAAARRRGAHGARARRRGGAPARRARPARRRARGGEPLCPRARLVARDRAGVRRVHPRGARPRRRSTGIAIVLVEDGDARDDRGRRARRGRRSSRRVGGAARGLGARATCSAAQTVYRRESPSRSIPEERQLVELGLRSRARRAACSSARGDRDDLVRRAPSRTRSRADEVELVSLLGRLVATAVQNIRAYEAERQTVEELRRLSALRADFVSLVSHELRSPMAAVIGAARTLQAALARAVARSSARRFSR